MDIRHASFGVMVWIRSPGSAQEGTFPAFRRARPGIGTGITGGSGTVVGTRPLTNVYVQPRLRPWRSFRCVGSRSPVPRRRPWRNLAVSGRLTTAFGPLELAVRRFRQDPIMLSATEVIDAYDAWLGRQASAPRTRSAYRRWVLELVDHLVAGDELDAFVSTSGHHDRRAAVADWRRRWSTDGSRRRRSIWR